jgi:pimeloyl-ACP methyl ester carboxylesterase
MSDDRSREPGLKDRALRTAMLAGAVVAGAGALVSIASSGLAVYFARRIVVPENQPEDLDILHVSGFDDDLVVQLPVTDDTILPGRYGLLFDSGRGLAQIGEILEYDPASQTVARRVLSVMAGDLHGRGATRAEVLRAGHVLDSIGMPSIAMSYRNDAEVREGDRSRYGLGDTEWFDVDVAIDYARAQGARQVVVFGWSMGGAIAFQAASRGRNRSFIAGLVLDGPVVDWHDVLDNQARLNYLPTPIARLTLDMITRPWARSITGLETPIDLERLDWVTRAAELDKPVLLIHSDDDQFVPSGPSHALARVRFDLVTMPQYDTAAHTKEWNVEPERWEDDVASFLESKIDLRGTRRRRA